MISVLNKQRSIKKERIKEAPDIIGGFFLRKAKINKLLRLVLAPFQPKLSLFAVFKFYEVTLGFASV